MKIIILCLFAGLTRAEEGTAPLVLLFSGSANGVLRSCHCPSNPWGGLAKRAWLMDELRAAAGPERVLALDSGDLFPVDSAPEQEVLLLRLYSLMGYQAVALGDQELRSGFRGWAEVNQRAGFWAPAEGHSSFPWLSAAHRLTARGQTGEPLAKPWAVFTRAGLRIGVVSVSSRELWAQKASPDGIACTRPLDVLRDFRKACQEPLDLVAVLSHQALEEDRQLASQCAGIDVIIGGHSQSLLVPPEVVNGTLICQAGKNGENLGVLLWAPRANTNPGRVFQPSLQAPAGAAPAGDAEGMFRTSVLETPRWRVAQRIIPLNERVDELGEVGELIGRHDAARDAQNAARLGTAAQLVPGSPAPRITLAMPTNPVSLTACAKREVIVPIRNPGTAELTVKQVRSRSPWLRVDAAPAAIAPGGEASLRFTLDGGRCDRQARSEFTVRTNDPERPVVQAAFPAVLGGARPLSLDVKALWQELCRELSSGAADRRAAMAPLLADLAPGAAPAESRPSPLALDFYFAPACEACQEIEQDVLEPLAERFEGRLSIRKRDVTESENYDRLTRLTGGRPDADDTTLTVVVDGKDALFGAPAIRRELPRIVEDRLERRPSAK